MKKIGALLAAAFVALCLAGCNNSSISQEDYDRVVSERDALQQQVDDLLAKQDEASSAVQTPDETSSEPKAPQITNQVLVDQDGIKITFMGIEDGFGTEVKLKIENSTETSITVQQRDMSVNGIMIDGILSSDVMPGKTANDSISILSTYLEKNDIETIENIELTFHIFNKDSHKTILDTDVIRIEIQ